MPHTGCSVDASGFSKCVEMKFEIPLRPTSPAQKLLIELDGEVHFISDLQARKYVFPSSVRSVTIRDENKRVRAHMLVEDMPASLFDADRLEISLQVSDQACLLIRDCQ